MNFMRSDKYKMNNVFFPRRDLAVHVRKNEKKTCWTLLQYSFHNKFQNNNEIQTQNKFFTLSTYITINIWPFNLIFSLETDFFRIFDKLSTNLMNIEHVFNHPYRAWCVSAPISYSIVSRYKKYAFLCIVREQTRYIYIYAMYVKQTEQKNLIGKRTVSPAHSTKILEPLCFYMYSVYIYVSLFFSLNCVSHRVGAKYIIHKRNVCKTKENRKVVLTAYCFPPFKRVMYVRFS